MPVLTVHSAEGEDRSSYQDVLPWTGDEFGFVKATETTDWRDPTFAANWAALKHEGKPRGAYHFLHAERSPVAQAEFFVSIVKEQGLEPGDMLVADSEVIPGPGGVLQPSIPDSMHAPNVPFTGEVGSGDLVGSCTLTFLQTVRSLAGPNIPVLCYTNLSVGALLGSCTDFDLFIAYPSATAPPSVAPWPKWRFWQWGFGGGQGGGDRDAYNGTVDELGQWIGSFRPPLPDAVPSSNPAS